MQSFVPADQLVGEGESGHETPTYISVMDSGGVVRRVNEGNSTMGGVLQCISAQGDGEWSSMLVSSVSHTHVTFS